MFNLSNLYMVESHYLEEVSKIIQSILFSLLCNPSPMGKHLLFVPSRYIVALGAPLMVQEQLHLLTERLMSIHQSVHLATHNDH